MVRTATADSVILMKLRSVCSMRKSKVRMRKAPDRLTINRDCKKQIRLNIILEGDKQNVKDGNSD